MTVTYDKRVYTVGGTGMTNRIIRLIFWWIEFLWGIALMIARQNDQEVVTFEIKEAK